MFFRLKLTGRKRKAIGGCPLSRVFKRRLIVLENPKAQVELINPNEAKIHFEADESEQRRIAKLSKGGENVEGKGVSGQFVIEYDVDRDPSGGQVIVSQWVSE